MLESQIEKGYKVRELVFAYIDVFSGSHFGLTFRVIVICLSQIQYFMLTNSSHSFSTSSYNHPLFYV